MGRIWDVVLLRDELDLLEMHLEELSPHVHRHVIIEARTDHQGHPKPLFFGANPPERFAPYLGKIVHVVADLPNTSDPWQNEIAQRDSVLPLLKAEMAIDDVVISADVDEIPNYRALDIALGLQEWEWRAIVLKMTMWAVDWVWPEPIRMSAAIPAGMIFRGFRISQARRDAPHDHIWDGGWHFTWLGGPDAVRAKALSHCHTEYNEALLAGADRFWADGTHPFYPPFMKLVPVNVDATWPAYIHQRRCPANWFRPRTTPASAKWPRGTRRLSR